MEEITAFKSLNGTIYKNKEEALAGDKKWITEKILDELVEFVHDKMGERDKLAHIAECREEVKALFEKYDHA